MHFPMLSEYYELLILLCPTTFPYISGYNLPKRITLFQSQPGMEVTNYSQATLTWQNFPHTSSKDI